MKRGLIFFYLLSGHSAACIGVKYSEFRSCYEKEKFWQPGYYRAGHA
jgi:hypothetical protein